MRGLALGHPDGSRLRRGEGTCKEAEKEQPERQGETSGRCDVLEAKGRKHFKEESDRSIMSAAASKLYKMRTENSLLDLRTQRSGLKNLITAVSVSYSCMLPRTFQRLPLLLHV